MLYDTSFPPNTAIRLGQLITDPRNPTESLANGPLTIESLGTVVDSGTKRDYVFRKQREREFGIGFSAAVLSLLPFGLQGDKERKTTHHFRIKTVEESMFLPSPEYVQKSVLQAEVLKYLAQHRYRKSLYMIVGIRVGCDAEVIHERKLGNGGKLSVAAPGSLTGIPVDFGAEIKAKSVDDYYERKHIPSSFVFAYRLREIRYFKKNDLIRDSVFTKGAELHDLHAKSVIPTLTLAGDTIAPYLGTPNEIDIDNIAGSDFEEDEDDSMIVDGCVMVVTRKKS